MPVIAREFAARLNRTARGDRRRLTLFLPQHGRSDCQENCKVQREGVRSVFSGSVHAEVLTDLAEKWTRPRTLQFSWSDCEPGLIDLLKMG
jgi:hypothetical protein